MKTIEERHLDFTLDDVFSRIRSEAADAPRIIHLIFDDIDGLSYFIPGTQPALLSQMVEILASVQARHPSLVIIPMFISARGPSLMNCGARTSRSVCEIEMRPMSDQTIQAIIKGRLQKKNGTFEESWKRYLWQFGGCPAQAVHAGYARPELGIECAKVGFYDRKAAGDPEIMLCMALVGYPIDPSLELIDTSLSPRALEAYINEGSIYRHMPHRPFGKRELIDMPLLMLEYYATFATRGK